MAGPAPPHTVAVPSQRHANCWLLSPEHEEEATTYVSSSFKNGSGEHRTPWVANAIDTPGGMLLGST
jgi:hypothetical protein